MIVDHDNPIHDGFCRCPTCKPSLVGERSSGLFWIRTAALALAGMLAFVVRVGG